MTEYGVYGPFRIPRDEWGGIDRQLSEFWNEVEGEEQGLSEAHGIYVFMIKPGRTERFEPWYVGKTQGSQHGFRGEVFQHHKLTCYHEAMRRYDRGIPHVILLPRLSRSGRFAHGQNARDLEFLENYCIGLAIDANPEIVNRRNTMHYSNVVVPGILNSPRRRQRNAEKVLRHALRLDQ